MSIPAGTLCLIVSTHPLAGRTCTVVEYRARGRYAIHNRTSSGALAGGFKRFRGPIYIVAGRFPRTPFGNATWGAEPRHLIPLAAPPAPEQERIEAAEEMTV